MTASKTFWSGTQNGGDWSATIDEDRLRIWLSVGAEPRLWSLQDFLVEAPRLIIDDAASAEVEAGAASALERALRLRMPPPGGWGGRSDCAICRAWPETLHHDKSTNSAATDARFPEGVQRLVWIYGDRGERRDARPEIRRCPDCGTYFQITHDYEWTPMGTDDDEWLSRLTPVQVLALLPDDEQAALMTRNAVGHDAVPTSPARAEKAAIEAAITGLVDPAAAWNTLREKGLLPEAATNPSWTFLEELFETCPSCNGTALDPYAGACYACSYPGKNLIGHRSSPCPPTMKDVVAFAADAAVMVRVGAAALAFVERLVAFGATPSTQLAWVLRGPSHVDDRAVIPQPIRPVFVALRDALADESIPTGGYDDGWFERGARAWQIARSKRIEPFVTRGDPFEPLGQILRAGYHVDVKDGAIRLICGE